MKFKMKSIKIVSVILLMVLLSVNILTVSAGPGFSALIGNWKFNERSGTTVNTSAGYVMTGTISGATWTPGISGTGLNFNGTSSRVTIPDHSYLNYSATESFTLSTWVNVPSLPNAWQGIISKGSWATSSQWYGIWISGDNKWVFGANGNNIFGSSVTTGWHYIAAVQDGTANKRYLYVDGALVANGNASNGSSTDELWIGGCKSTGEYFKGIIDEVNLCSYTVTASTILTEFRKYNRTTVCNWKFDEASGSTVADSSGNGFNGTNYGGSYWAAGKDESCARYYSSNYTYVPSNSRFNFSKDDNFTITTWVNIPYNASRWQGVITKGRGTANWYGLWISGDNRWVFGGNGNNIFGSTVTTGWHHIAIVQDGSNNVRQLYVDGSLSASGTTSDASAYAGIFIGGCDFVSEYFNGRVDDVKLYNYALTSATVSSYAAEYNHKLGVQTYTQQPYSQLCWATSASMIISYFLDDIVDRKVQIAQDRYGTTDFNHPASWSDILYYINRYTGRSGTLGSGTLSYSSIASNIDAKKPIPYSIYWSSGGGHALVMRGYQTMFFPILGQYVLVNDPGDGEMHYYSHSYLTSNSSFTWDGYATY